MLIDPPHCMKETIMGFATHLGPWLLGTVKETTGTTAGTIRNTGATTAMQTKTVAYGDTTAQTLMCVLPAGTIIHSIKYLITTAYTTTAPTFTMFINGTQVTAASTLSTTAGGLLGMQEIPLGGNSAAGAALIANVGTNDALLAFTHANGGGTTGAGTLIVEYAVRNSDGSAFPASA